MSGLSTADFHDHAAAENAEAWRTIAAHSTQAYTGVCVVCGRPGPCDEQRAARRKLARYAGTGPSPGSAVQSVAESLDDLRTAWATLIVANDRAATLATAVRLRLIVAGDQLRRTGTPAGLVAARRWAAAVRRLNLVAARRCREHPGRWRTVRRRIVEEPSW